jgi:hypothetical protein
MKRRCTVRAMTSFNATAALEEARRLLMLTIGAGAVTALVLFLDSKGGHLAAGLGVTATLFAIRLLLDAAKRPAE